MMPLYIRKPTTVIAQQFTSESSPPHGVDWSDSLGHYVTTMQGRHVCVSIGEWIVKEPNGKGYYPVDHDEFVRLYDPVMKAHTGKTA